MRNRGLTSQAHEDKMAKLHWRYIERPRRILVGYLRKLLKRPTDNATIIHKEACADRGRLVLLDWDVVRLLGWSNIPNDDYYWVVLASDFRIVQSSCVGGFTPLYGVLSGFDYFQLASNWNLNGLSYENGLKMAKEQGIEVL